MRTSEIIKKVRAELNITQESLEMGVNMHDKR